MKYFNAFIGITLLTVSAVYFVSEDVAEATFYAVIAFMNIYVYKEAK